MPNKEDFIKEIQRLKQEAREKGLEYVDIISGDVHRTLGGYPGKNHRMRTCCEAMYELMESKDDVRYAPGSSYGATVEIRYYL